MLKRMVIGIIVLTVWMGSATAADMYVQSRKAPFWSAPSFKAEQLKALVLGTRVQTVDEQDGWYCIRYGDQQGWMLKIMLSADPPINPTPAQQKAMDELTQRARRRPSAFANTAAARGLNQKRQRFGEKLRLDFDAVAKMENWRADDQQALEFLKEGVGDENKYE